VIKERTGHDANGRDPPALITLSLFHFVTLGVAAMCRFVLYLGPSLPLSDFITEPSNSLIHQSFHGHERAERLNGDGFGVAWYAPELSDEPAVFRCVTPAWNNRNLQSLARVTRSGCLLAHVRAASTGMVVTETNCHPFTHGRYAFMHNGEVGGFARIRRQLVAMLSDEAYGAIEGTTDSEHVFALFLDRLKDADPKDPAQAMAMADALLAAIRQLVALEKAGGGKEHSYLNIAIADGRSAVISHFTTDAARRAVGLHITTGRRYVCEQRACRMLHPPGDHGATIVSSEPLSDDPGWEPVPVNHLVVIRPDHNVRMVPCEV
jgi:ergothioneine biosynthesis protein EgtC